MAEMYFPSRHWAIPYMRYRAIGFWGKRIQVDRVEIACGCYPNTLGNVHWTVQFGYNSNTLDKTSSIRSAIKMLERGGKMLCHIWRPLTRIPCQPVWARASACAQCAIDDVVGYIQSGRLNRRCIYHAMCYNIFIIDIVTYSHWTFHLIYVAYSSAGEHYVLCRRRWWVAYAISVVGVLIPFWNTVSSRSSS